MVTIVYPVAECTSGFNDFIDLCPIKEHPGPKNTAVIEANIEIVREFNENEPKSYLIYMAMELNMSKLQKLNSSRSGIHRVIVPGIHQVIEVCITYYTKFVSAI